MNSFYGGGGVESRHAIAGRRLKSDLKGDGSPLGPRHPKAAMAQGNVDHGDTERKPPSRSSDRPASTFHGSQSGANPGPTNPAGCQLYERYARDACADGPPDVITHDYADLSRGW